MALSLIIFLIVIPILLVVSGFFSAAETGITAASRPKLHQLAKEGDPRAKIIQDLQNNLSLTISALLLGNQFFNTLAVSIATGLLINIVGQEGIAYATIMMGTLITIYAEVAPKILAVQNPEPFLLKSSKVLRFLFAVFYPLLRLINLVARISLRLIGVRIDENQMRHGTVEELRGAIDLHMGPGQDIAEERAMLRSILDLSDVQVNEIMTHRKNVTMIDAGENPQKIVEQVLASPFTRLPLFKGDPDNIIGIVHAKALLRAVRAHPSDDSGNLDLEGLDIESIAGKPWFIPESTDLLEQLKAFRARREHFAIVVDEYGSLQGIVTLEDILEEIVGEISDEHDITVKGVRPQAHGSYIVDGSVTIRDLNRQFEWDLPDEPAATVAGLVLYEVRRIPDVGQVFMLYGFRFEVMRRQRNQITLLRITPPEKEGNEESKSPPRSTP